MGSVCDIKVILHALNIINVVLGLAIAATSIWFMIQVHVFTSLRNKNHYLLDYTVYWPQFVPWIFFVVAILVLCVSCCGFIGFSKNNRDLTVVYIISLSVVIICLIAASVVALVLADDKSTDEFVKDITWDVYSQMKTDNEIAEAFGIIERKLHCCGIVSPRDYKSWKDEFPMSCCDGFHYGWLEPYTVDCKFSNKFANERHGCADVAAHYARITIKVMSGASIFTTVIAVISFIVAVLHYPEF